MMDLKASWWRPVAARRSVISALLLVLVLTFFTHRHRSQIIITSQQCSSSPIHSVDPNSPYSPSKAPDLFDLLLRIQAVARFAELSLFIETGSGDAEIIRGLHQLQMFDQMWTIEVDEQKLSRCQSTFTNHEVHRVECIHGTQNEQQH